MFENLSVERELERAGVPLFAWNEPIKLDGGRAQQILQRRINQSVTEYEVFNALELSWGGICTHVREGWNIGRPPYGYNLRRIRHPNPLRASKGLTKSRLEPHGSKAEVVNQMAHWRYYEWLGYETITDLLNADPERYPSPLPYGAKRARGAWSKSAVTDMLLNPKYTGYQVYNRRSASTGRRTFKDPSLWVWSSEPSHEPLIPKWMFDEMYARRRAHAGSRDGGDRDSHVQTCRTYVLRGRVFCGCRRRMSGVCRGTGGTRTYYMCWPKPIRVGHSGWYPEHPTTLYVREEVFLDGISHLLRTGCSVRTVATSSPPISPLARIMRCRSARLSAISFSGESTTSPDASEMCSTRVATAPS
ncbi:recombinase family protein [Streptomyces sp. NPDC059037]|uniref:recombinase family protein n=1 Tax=Streptomyces sp. NPDC059037 TaxID=3346710 RepID=UPI00369FFDDB